MRSAAERLLANMERGVNEGAALVDSSAKQNLKGDKRGKHLMSSIHTEMESSGTTVTAAVGVGAATGIDSGFYRYKGGGEDTGNDPAEMFGIFVHEGTGIYSRTGTGRPDVPWPFINDEGETCWTSGMQPNPFLENAYNENGERVARIIADALSRG